MKGSDISILTTPLGPIRLEAGPVGLTGLHFLDEEPPPSPPPPGSLLEEASAQIQAYFDRELREFDLPLAPEGTDFQRQVWNALLQIPWGGTVSYAALARLVGSPDAMRAVGAANGRNPISIIIPCHRVIGANGSLTGYGGGLHRKQALLELEGIRVGAPPGQRGLF